MLSKVAYFFCRKRRSAAIWAAMTANSDWAQAKSILLLAFLDGFFRSGFGGMAFIVQILPRMAVSDKTVTQLGCTSRYRQRRRRTLRCRRPFQCEQNRP